MLRARKTEIVDSLRDVFSDAGVIVVTHYQGLSVAKVTELRRGMREAGAQFRVEKAGLVHGGVGKASFEDAQLLDNIKAFVDAVNRAKPAGAKGTYLKRAAISSTMGPGVHVEVASLVG